MEVAEFQKYLLHTEALLPTYLPSPQTYSRPIPMTLLWSWGGGRLVTSEVPLYTGSSRTYDPPCEALGQLGQDEPASG